MSKPKKPRSAAKPKTVIKYRTKTAPAKPARRRRAGGHRSGGKGLLREMEPVLLATVGSIASLVIIKKLPVAKSPNGEKIKTAAVMGGATLLAGKMRDPLAKSILGGIAVGAGVALAKQLFPAQLAGDDLLGDYYSPLGSIDAATAYAGLGEIAGAIDGDDLLGGSLDALDFGGDPTDLYGDELLGDELLGDDLLGDDMYGDDSYL